MRKTLLLFHFFLLVITFRGITVPYQNLQQSDRHQQVRDLFRIGKLRDGQNILNQLLQQDSLHPETHYLYAELSLLYGKPEFWKHMDFIRKFGTEEQKIVLETKLNLFLGTAKKEVLICKGLQLYPRNPELLICNWINMLEKENFKKCYKSLEEVSKSLFGFQAYKALYFTLWTSNKSLALEIHSKCKEKLDYTIDSKFTPLLTLPQKVYNPLLDSIELPFAWYDPYMVIQMKGKNGTQCNLSIDSGTGYDLITLHTKKKGQSLSGRDTICIKNGITYNYMDSPQDMHYKLANFSQPEVSRAITGYFKGDLRAYDGCISPLAFRPYAFHIDPIHGKVWLRSKESMKQIRKREKGNYFSIPYIERCGWIYVPCRVNGQEVLMMLETGSSNVNLNNYSTKKLGLTPYKETIQWRGKDYNVKKVDFTLQLGEMEYQVKGGGSGNFVLGNKYYGIAASGDLGPEFLRNFEFIIDPAKKELIIFRENNRLLSKKMSYQ